MADENKPTIPLNELMARKLEGLAARVRQREIVGFDLAWNLGVANQDPTRLFGVFLGHAYNADSFLDSLKPDTANAILRDITKALSSNVIEVEDRTAVDEPVGPPVVPDTDTTAPEIELETADLEPEDDDEDFHVKPDEPDDDDEDKE